MNYKKLFCQIGKLQGVSEEEVRQEIEKAINAAYTNPNKSTDVEAYQNKIPCKGEIPTPEEFMSFVIEQVKQLESN